MADNCVNRSSWVNTRMVARTISKTIAARKTASKTWRPFELSLSVAIPPASRPAEMSRLSAMIPAWLLSGDESPTAL